MKKGIILLLMMVTTGLMMPGTVVGISADFLIGQDQEIIYKEIKVEEVPELVNEAFMEYFRDYIINKAYRGDDNSYKLEVSKDHIQYVLFYTESGKLIKMEQPESTKK